ncbi:MAG: glutamine synthetase, partial [Gammaproteobacteria bacterium]|nr:glutamine synthetase [Gammaproteobacteria bacterium]
DGIQNKINPGDAMDKDLYDLEPEEDKKIPKVCFSLEQALEALDKDRDFLKAGNVFSDDLIDAYINLKYADMMRIRMAVHPLEFQLYYSL